ncbi:MAG: hypothetical protein F6K58_11090 [Symploca sp. SIO2E9]|nr:hypothetical protein [Symploca sp. SIO2E9]
MTDVNSTNSSDVKKQKLTDNKQISATTTEAQDKTSGSSESGKKQGTRIMTHGDCPIPNCNPLLQDCWPCSDP